MKHALLSTGLLPPEVSCSLKALRIMIWNCLVLDSKWIRATPRLVKEVVVITIIATSEHAIAILVACCRGIRPVFIPPANHPIYAAVVDFTICHSQLHVYIAIHSGNGMAALFLVSPTRAWLTPLHGRHHKAPPQPCCALAL